MSEVTRYDVSLTDICKMLENNEHGRWVMYTDYQAAQATEELEKLGVKL